MTIQNSEDTKTKVSSQTEAAEASQNAEDETTPKSEGSTETKKPISEKAAQDWKALHDKHNLEITAKDSEITKLKTQLEQAQQAQPDQSVSPNSSDDKLKALIGQIVQEQITPLTTDISSFKQQQQEKEIEIKGRKLTELGFTVSDFEEAQRANPHIKTLDDFIVNAVLNHPDRIAEAYFNKKNPSANAVAGSPNVNNNKDGLNEAQKAARLAAAKQDAEKTLTDMGLFEPAKPVKTT